MKEESAPRDAAVALRYDPESDRAPVVVARGQGYIAERIKEIASESGIPLKEDPYLAEYLLGLELYQEIPVELYQVVAEILAFIYRMDRSHEKENP